MQLEHIQAYFMSYKPWLSLAIILLSAMIYRQIHHMLIRRMKRSNRTISQIGNLELLFNIVKHFLAVILLLIAFNINGINVSTMLTGLGVSGIVIGFALQDIMKDWFMGVTIVWDSYFSVGDVIECNDAIGKVVEFNLKTTKIKDIVNGNIVVISNRNISQVSVLSDWLDVEVHASYDTPSTEMEEIIDEITHKIKALPTVSDARYLNITSFEESLIQYRVRVFCEPEHRFQTKRNCHTIIKKVYEEHHMSIPYNQLDVHMIQQ